jgi:hypothetical protein
MIYYKIGVKIHYNERIASAVNGKNVLDNDYFFSKIRKGEIISDAPIFDYFVLESYDNEDYWEWSLFDVFNGMGDFPHNGNWYISNKLKGLLEKFKIANPYHFYETKFLFKEEKLKFWIFQFIAAYRKINKMQYVDFTKSHFKVNDQNYNFNSYEEWSNTNGIIYDKYKLDVKPQKVCLNQNIDFIPLNPISSDIICSENLRNAIQENEITGFEFLELEYEVVIEQP